MVAYKEADEWELWVIEDNTEMEEEVLCEFQNSANLMLNSKIDN